ncbi:MAG: MATE family efflux transporter [Patescibacteria group bacterium]|jgi:putative MATE family efflux protein|nr:MATE family efflux transporter [Patescibacteria group bacterium]
MKSKILGEEKIPKLLFKQALPAMVGMFVMSLYNVVDTIYIGRGVGTLALAGVSVSLPIIMSLLAVSMAVGIGSASVISRSLGAGEYEKVKESFGNYILLLIVFSVILLSVGYIFLIPVISFFGATPDILSYATEYTSVLLMGAIFFLFMSSANNIIRASGHAGFAMTTMLVGAVINLILDPIFIFYFKLGVKGAAYATVISWIVGSLYVLYYYFKINTIKISFHHLKFKLNIVKEIIAVGISSFARQIAVSIMTIVVNTSLATLGSSMALAAFGIISRLSMLAMMPIFGIVQGMQPIVGYNWGAKKFERVKESIFLSLKVSTYVSVFAFIVLFFFTKPIVSVFTSDTSLIELTSSALKIIVLMFPLIGLQVVAGGLYQSLGKARPAFILSILRQLILLVPLVLILPHYYNLHGVWYSFPISDFIAAVVTLIFIYREIVIINKLKSVIT